SCFDPNGDSLTYDVYFGTSNNPQLVASNQSTASFNPGQLNNSTTYYWKIVAKDNQGASTTGPVWSFATIDQNPSSPRGELKIFLEGPYYGNTMVTDLDSFALVPLTQPYNENPWNYNGNEAVDSIPPEIVDWILLELRTSPAASSVVSRRAAFVRNDGMVVDLNGDIKVTFAGVNSGSYYIVVRHRNHLSIMSKNPVEISDFPALYDFTTSQDKAYGSQPMKLLNNGKYGMYSGDGNGNGSVNTADYNTVWKKENGSIGYKEGDFDLNGGVNIVDSNAKWKPNKGKVTQVP
ncbi:MAG TPA: hypothetical protein VLB50_09120, partial [Ignavibacteriaceae bacterium]|nr:hypothetical protein [Ignavibacteriaceae bacterium]